MVVISTGDHPSARRFSRLLGLKRLRGAWRFPVFADGEEVAGARRLLFVPANAPIAAAWGFILGRLSQTQDLRRCVACALLPAQIGGIGLINRTEYLGRNYYPDVLVNPGIPERTGSEESSGEFLRTALFFLAPHQIVCLEACGGTVEDRDAALIAALVTELEEALPDSRELTAEEQRLTDTFARTHDCSRAETDRLLRSVRSFAIRTGRFPAELLCGEGIRAAGSNEARAKAVLAALEKE